jgi:hypothetical protein
MDSTTGLVIFSFRITREILFVEARSFLAICLMLNRSTS